MGKKKTPISMEPSMQTSSAETGDGGLPNMAFIIHPICLSINTEQTSWPWTLPRKPCDRHMGFVGSRNQGWSSHRGCSTHSCRHLVLRGAGNEVRIHDLSQSLSWPSYLRFSGVITRGMSELGNELPRNSASLAQIMMLQVSTKHCSLITYIYPLFLNCVFQEISSALFLM